MLLQCRYEITLFPNYFITSLLLLYSSHLVFLLFLHLYLFSFLKFFQYCFLWFFMEFTILHQIKMFCFTLWPRQYYNWQQNYIDYVLLSCAKKQSEAANSSIYNWQQNYIDYVLLSCAKKQSEAATSSIATMLNCIHAHHVSNNLNGVKPQSYALSQP